ncbi:MAG: Mu transposase C-terminal domain-containing protein [Terriglobia bacterium]
MVSQPPILSESEEQPPLNFQLSSGHRQYGFELEYRPPERPTYGAHIERLIGTMMGEIHLLPGTTFSSVADRGEYDSAHSAAMTLKEFETWFTWQVAGVYHQRIHSGLGMPPLHAWKLGVHKHPGAIRPVLDPKRFYVDFLPFELRKVRRDGIRLFNIQYCDSALEPMAARSEQKYAIKYDPRDLSRVYLKERSGEFVTIRYRDLSRPPISSWEHRWATHELRRQGRLAVNEDNLFAAIEAQRRVVEKARVDTQTARRKPQRNTLNRTAENRSRPPLPTSMGAELIGPVKPYHWEIWE